MCEKNIIEGCSPTLAGLKTGNLISVGYPDAESLYADIREMNRIFVRKGLCAVPLGYSSGRGLIYIYRTADLRRDLKSPEALRELPRMGYCCKSVGACVARLAERVRECSISGAGRREGSAGPSETCAGPSETCTGCRAAGAQCSNPEDGGFPHEIGFFLGYPPEDVIGFMYHRDEGCKLTGLWKVYGDAEKAEKIFSKCRKCREVYKEQWLSGRSIDQLTVRTFARS